MQQAGSGQQVMHRVCTLFTENVMSPVGLNMKVVVGAVHRQATHNPDTVKAGPEIQ